MGNGQVKDRRAVWETTKPFALITRQQFDDVPQDPCNAQATHRAFLEVADMIQEEWA